MNIRRALTAIAGTLRGEQLSYDEQRAAEQSLAAGPLPRVQAEVRSSRVTG